MPESETTSQLKEYLGIVDSIPPKYIKNFEKNNNFKSSFYTLKNNYGFYEKLREIRLNNRKWVTCLIWIFIIISIIYPFELQNGVVIIDLRFIWLPLLFIFIGRYLEKRCNQQILRARDAQELSCRLLCKRIQHIMYYLPSVVLSDCSKNSLFDPAEMKEELVSTAQKVRILLQNLYAFSEKLSHEIREEWASPDKPSELESELRECQDELDLTRKRLQRIYRINEKFSITPLTYQELFPETKKEGVLVH